MTPGVANAVVFDLGGTLWHWPDKDPTRDGGWFWGRSYDHCTGLLPVSSGILRIGREAFAAAMVAAEEDYRQRARTEARSRTPDLIAADGLRRLGVPPRPQEVSVALEGYGRAAVGWATPFPDAVPTLFRLRNAGYGIGVLSNTWWSAAWLDADLGRLGLARLVDAVLYTSGLRHAKPHPSVFLEAAERLGVPPNRCVMVGDDPLCDVSGALAAGMKAVWKRNGRPATDHVHTLPTAKIDDLAELPGVIGLRPG